MEKKIKIYLQRFSQNSGQAPYKNFDKTSEIFRKLTNKSKNSTAKQLKIQLTDILKKHQIKELYLIMDVIKSEIKAKLYKTKMCWFFMDGSCKLGEYCSFAHGIHELRNPDLSLISQTPIYQQDQTLKLEQLGKIDDNASIISSIFQDRLQSEAIEGNHSQQDKQKLNDEDQGSENQIVDQDKILQQCHEEETTSTDEEHSNYNSNTYENSKVNESINEFQQEHLKNKIPYFEEAIEDEIEDDTDKHQDLLSRVKICLQILQSIQYRQIETSQDRQNEQCHINNRYISDECCQESIFQKYSGDIDYNEELRKDFIKINTKMRKIENRRNLRQVK